MASLMWTLGAGPVGHSSRSRSSSSSLSRSNTYGGARPRTTSNTGSRSNQGQTVPHHPTPSNIIPATVPSSSANDPPPYSQLARSRSLGRSPNRTGSMDSSNPQPNSSQSARPRRLLPEPPSFLGSFLHASPSTSCSSSTQVSVEQARSHSPSPHRGLAQSIQESENQRRGSAASVSPSRSHQVARATLSAPGSVSPRQSPSPVSNTSLAGIQNAFSANRAGRSTTATTTTTSQNYSPHNQLASLAPTTTYSTLQGVTALSNTSTSQALPRVTSQMEVPTATPEIRRGSHPGVLTLYFDSNNSSPVTMSPTSRSANPSPGYLSCNTPVTSPRQPNLSPSRIPAQHSSQSPPSVTGARSRLVAEAFTFGKETTC